MTPYGALLIDPPWRFEVWNRDTGNGRSAELHYPTMSLSDLIALPVEPLMADDCVVFMWATWPTITDAFVLGKAWGLEYKTCAFLWAKMNKHMAGRFGIVEHIANWFVGMGYWTRANTEPCLLFTKGNPKRLHADVRQLIVSPVREHSRKPDEIYTRIERLVAGPYCELFARQSWPNWARWGNEVESTVSLGVNYHE